jgi:hypothetical protein
VDDPGPVFAMDWVLQRGVADDALVCDAWRAALAAGRQRTEALGLSMRVLCGARETTVRIVGIAEQFEEAWPAIASLMRPDPLPPAAVERHVAHALSARARRRQDEEMRNHWFHAVALLGERGVDPHLPTDAVLGRVDPASLTAALDVSVSVTPDVLYAGPPRPHLADRLRVSETPPARPVELDAPRELEVPLVLVLHDPDRARADVRRTLRAPLQRAHDLLLNEIFRATGFRSAPLDSPRPAQFYATPISEALGAGGIAALGGVECASEDVLLAVRSLVEAHARMPDVEAWNRARSVIEEDYRAARRSGIDRARIVQRWPALGTRTDPAMEVWLGLASATTADLAAYAEAVRDSPAIISVIADLDRFPVEALEAYGVVHRLELTDLRDPDLSVWTLFGLDPLEDGLWVGGN